MTSKTDLKIIEFTPNTGAVRYVCDEGELYICGPNGEEIDMYKALWIYEKAKLRLMQESGFK